MIRPNYKYFRKQLLHSAKGSTWEEHKYIKRIDGTYYYPDSYEGGRHLPDGESKGDADSNGSSISEADIENLANEVIKGNFGNGQERKDLLGEYYEAVQKRVNEILKGGAGSKKVSEATPESIQKAEEAAKNASKTSGKDSKTHTGIDMDQVLAVYKNKK